MSLTFGFYNSLNGDRKYDAVQFSQIFDGVINDGVFMSIGEKLMVTAAEGMTVKVGIGRAWFNGTWTYNDAPLMLNLDLSEVLLDRIDTVVLEVDTNQDARKNDIKIIKGEPSTMPMAAALTNDDNLHQYPLARIYVTKGSQKLSQADITNTVGTSACPFVTGILETMDIDELIRQWEGQWRDWIGEKTATTDKFITDTEAELEIWKNELDTWKDEIVSDTEVFQETQQRNFNNWFSNVRNQLNEDVAGNLQNQIDGLAGLKFEVKMKASKWVDNKYSFEEDYPYEQYDIEIEPSDTCTIEQLDAWANARIVGSSTSNVCTAFVETPTIDIPIIIKVVTK